MAWTNLTFAFGSILTSSKMTQLDANLDALSAGDSGSPKIQEAAITGQAAVDQSALKSTFADHAVSCTAVSPNSFCTWTVFTATGGEFIMGWVAKEGTNATLVVVTGWQNNTASFQARMTGTMNRTGFGAIAGTVRERYVQASPPYNLGFGDIPLFIFALIDNVTKDIVAMDIAEDPPWANNGPTKIIPTGGFDIATGKKFRLVKQYVVDGVDIQALLRNPITRDDALDRIANDEFVKQEITQQLKNADIDLSPNPYIGNTVAHLAGKTIVSVDPDSPELVRLNEMRNAGEDIVDIIRDGFLSFKNTPIERGFHSSVTTVKLEWKST